MKRALAQRLTLAGRTDLIDFFDIYTSRVRNFNSQRHSIYWVHDLARDVETEHLADDLHIFNCHHFRIALAAAGVSAALRDDKTKPVCDAQCDRGV